MNRFSAPAVLTCCFLASFLVTDCQAQPQKEKRQSQFGEIELEGYDEGKSRHSTNQDQAIEYFNKLSAISDGLAQGSISAPESMNEDILFYLTGVYLYCAVNSGTCPLILDAMAEAETIRSVVSGSVECSGLKKFWKLWVKNGMEDRHKYLVKTAYMRAHNDFNAKERPKYIKCDDLIKGRMAGMSSKEAFLKQRYAPGSAAKESITKVAQLLEQIKAKRINVFVATGSGS
ncbi:MAG: hypothetical protein DCC75_13085 [Proteobacteria bacterium]|nr:MAG: hypothetical protein DCC75_13085 [Pseudomonadota bacterium]